MLKMQETNPFCDDMEDEEDSVSKETLNDKSKKKEDKKLNNPSDTVEETWKSEKDEKVEETTVNRFINRLKKPDQPNALTSKLSIMLNKAHSSTSLQDKARTSKVWHGVVNVAVIEAWNLPPLRNNHLPDPFVRVKLGLEKFKSKTKSKTLSPKWMEEWILYMYDDTEPVLEVSIKNTEIGSKETILGECCVNLNEYEEETTHSLKLPLIKNDMDNTDTSIDVKASGFVHLLISISFLGNHIEGDTPFNKPKRNMAQQKLNFSYLKTLMDMERVGWLQIKVVKALGVEAVDLRGTSDPYCVLQLDNNRIQTQTIYKTVNPEWNRSFDMDIKDIHSTLTVTIYDENKNRRVEFLGRVSIPLLKIRNGENVWYQMKDSNLACKAKGILLLQIQYVYNPIRAVVRTFQPKEQLYIQQEAKLKISVMKRNVERTRRLVMMMADCAKEISSCLNWHSKPKSILAYLVYCAVVMLLELYMIPLFLIITITTFLVISHITNCFRDNSDMLFVNGEADEFEEDLDTKEEKKSLLDKFQGLQEVGLVVQEVLDQVVSSWEKIRNLFFWKSPWLTCVALLLLIFATIILFLIPFRILLLIWGTRKFSKKFIDPKYVDNNEVLDYISRLPSDKDLFHHRELPPDPFLMTIVKREETQMKIK